MVFHESHWIKGYSTTQKVIALSSGEAELFRLVKGASHALGIRSSLQDMGRTLSIQLNTDATAAEGIASRSG